MSTKLFLELGDIIRINAPSNQHLHEHTFYIDYLDQNVMSLIDDKSLEKTIVNIDEDYKLGEGIESIEILNKSDEKGYAKQNNFNISNWLSIHIGGILPAVLIGQVTDLEEDMIEVSIWPDNEKIYIDFAYKGLPLDIPFKKIVVRGPPPRSSLQKDVEIDINTEIKPEEPEIEIRLKEILLKADEIEFGDELEEITEIINVPKEERRYDIESQKNDMLDDFLSIIPPTDRTKNVINSIHIMIERFDQIRTEFSIMDNYGLPTRRQSLETKPLIKELLYLKKKILWILPIVKNRRKLYDIYDDESEDFLDISVQNLVQDLRNIQDLVDQYDDDATPDGQNKYNFLMSNLNPHLTPFDRAEDTDNIITTMPVYDNLDVIIDNYDFLNSSIAVQHDQGEGRSKVSTGFGIITRYTLGLTQLFVEKLKNFQTKTSRIPLTNNDILNLRGFIFFPYPIIKYNSINLIQTNMLTRANLHCLELNYRSIIQSLSDKVKTHDIKDIHNEFNYSEFIDDTKILTLQENLEDDDKYKNFLNTIIPTTINFFNFIKKKIKNPVSFSKILEVLEFFMIYDKNVTFKDYKVINSYLNEKIFETKREIQKFEKENDLYYNYEYDVKMEASESFIDPTLRDLYNLKTNSIPEIFKKMLSEDNGKIFMDYISTLDLDLHSTINIEEKVRADLETLNLNLEKKREVDTCKKYILTKEYENISDLNKDDNNPDVFFDKQYDVTPYEIMNEFKIAQEAMSREDFRDFLKTHLKNNIGMSEKNAEKEVEALLLKKKRVEENQYAILRDSNKIHYYTRKNNQWVLDEDLKNKQLKDVFCNIQNKCLKINNTCNNQDVSRSKINKRILKEILLHFDRELFVSKDDLKQQLDKNLKFDIGNILRLRLLNNFKNFKWDMMKFQIGYQLEPKELETVVSPYENLRNSILNQTDFVKKQRDIILFVERYCREEEGDKFWYYCISTNIRLLPSFYKILADSYKLGNYRKTLDMICRNRGTISDDGNNIVDKHSGYIIKSIEFDYSEGYDKSGFKIVSREILKKDLGERITETSEEKQYNSVNARKIDNVIIAISSHMGISLLNEYEFIMNNVLNCLKNETILQNYNLQSKKRGKRRVPFQTLSDEFLLYYTLAHILISIQTAIPSIRTRKTFPGCQKSFSGFPLGPKSDLMGLKYLVCIANKIKSQGKPWYTIMKSKEDKIIKRLTDLLVKKVLKGEHIKNKIKLKKEHQSQEPEQFIPMEHDIALWSTFLPPLQEISVPKTRPLGAGFEGTFKKNIKLGNKSQFDQLSIIEGKMMYFSLSIQEAIQNIIRREDPILSGNNNEPFLENVCCNDGLKNVLDYFMNADKSIDKNNRTVNVLNNLYYFFKNLTRPIMFFDPTNTFIIFPKISNIFSEETVYKAFLYYCQFNSEIPVADELLPLCLSTDSSILSTDTFEIKVQKLKEEGKIFSENHLVELLTIIGRNNYIENEINNEQIHPHQKLIATLQLFESRDQEIIPEQLLETLTILTDSFDVNDWAIEGKEYNSVKKLKNYLFKINNTLRNVIIDFIKLHGGIRGKKLLKREDFLKTLTIWKLKGDNTYMNKLDETTFFIGDFLKEAIVDITEIYPTILMNNVNYKNIHIPGHWGVSNFHKMEFKKIISNELQEFTSFYNDKLNSLLKNIKEISKNLLLLMNNIPFFAKIGDRDTIFDCTLYKDINEFFFLKSLNNYIIFSNDLED